MQLVNDSRRVFLARATAFATASALASLGCSRSGDATDVATPASEDAGPAGPLTAAVKAQLLLIAQRIFPHPGLSAETYSVVVGALEGAAGQAAPVAAMLTAGVSDLDRAADGAFAQRSADEQTNLLKAIEVTPFFQTVRGTAVFTFYNQPAVWDAFGYEGDAWAKGGYLGRGLNDINWLPEPKATAGAQ
jgi:hypothetical protein